MTLDEINNLNKDEFVARLGAVFEGAPWIAADAWAARPFESVEQLHGAMCAVMYGVRRELKVALIRGHPDLVGRAALTGMLSPESAGEQAAADLDSLTPEEIAEFKSLNAKYRDKFGFPFVICARENKKESILAGFSSRLGNTREEEIDIALREIAKIARLRLLDITTE